MTIFRVSYSMITKISISKQCFINILKFSIFILALYLIYRKLESSFSRVSLIELQGNIHSNTHLMIFLIVTIIMLFNWGIEALKWKILLKNIENISFKNAFKDVLSGVAIGFFTPNRIGEPVGRVINLRNNMRVKAIISGAVGSLSQLLVTLIFGIIAVSALLYTESILIISDFSKNLIASLTIILTILILYVYFNPVKLFQVIPKHKSWKKIHENLSHLSGYSTQNLILILFLSIFRFFVFSSQFFALLYLANVKLSIFEAAMAIPASYIIMTIIPSFALTEVGIRGSVTVYLIGLFSANIAGILCATLVLWLINIAIPSIAGSIIIYKALHNT